MKRIRLLLLALALTASVFAGGAEPAQAAKVCIASDGSFSTTCNSDVICLRWCGAVPGVFCEGLTAKTDGCCNCNYQF